MIRQSLYGDGARLFCGPHVVARRTIPFTHKELPPHAITRIRGHRLGEISRPFDVVMVTPFGARGHYPADPKRPLEGLNWTVQKTAFLEI